MLTENLVQEAIELINGIEYEISPELRAKCERLWDITNNKIEELEETAGTWDGNRLFRMRSHISDNWSRQDMMNYHMGTIFQGNNGTIKWALRNAPNKIKAIEYYTGEERGRPLTMDSFNTTFDEIQNILKATGKDEVMFAYMENEYNYWDSLPDTEFYAI